MEKLRMSLRNKEGATFGEAICNFRIAAGLTQRELAQKSGVTQTEISHIECAGYLPRITTLVAICLALDLDLDINLSDKVKTVGALNLKTNKE